MAELREQQQYDADRRLAAELQDDQQQHIPYEQQPIYGQPPWPDDSGRGCCSDDVQYSSFRSGCRRSLGDMMPAVADRLRLPPRPGWCRALSE